MSMDKFITMNLLAARKTVLILISWLLKKPADQDLHCFSHKDISRISRTRVTGNKVMHMQHHVKSVTVCFSFYIKKIAACFLMLH